MHAHVPDKPRTGDAHDTHSQIPYRFPVATLYGTKALLQLQRLTSEEALAVTRTTWDSSRCYLDSRLSASPNTINRVRGYYINRVRGH